MKGEKDRQTKHYLLTVLTAASVQTLPPLPLSAAPMIPVIPHLEYSFDQLNEFIAAKLKEFDLQKKQAEKLNINDQVLTLQIAIFSDYQVIAQELSKIDQRKLPPDLRISAKELQKILEECIKCKKMPILWNIKSSSGRMKHKLKDMNL